MTEQQSKFNFTLREMIMLPLGFLLNMSPLWALTLMVTLAALCGVLYYSLNSSFGGLFAPPFNDLTFSRDYTNVTGKDGRSWKILFEKTSPSIFTGVVRHVSHWRDEPIPFATHDILVTTGEYTSPSIVTQRVYQHAVYYQWYTDADPRGSINLLHIVPANIEIYNQLLAVREWNLVTIRGQEILRIEIFKKDGAFDSFFQDAGCNSILVTSVEIQAQGTPIP